MNIDQLISQLQIMKSEFGGDSTVCLAQLQGNQKTVRMTGVRELFFQYGVVYLTNMSGPEIAEKLAD